MYEPWSRKKWVFIILNTYYTQNLPKINNILKLCAINISTVHFKKIKSGIRVFNQPD